MNMAANGKGVTNLMTWDQVREMVNAGMTIGSHTVSHQILAKATPEQVEEELVGSRLKIEKETGRPCWCFAYPNGERSDFRVSDQVALKAAGYTCAFTQIPGFISAKTNHYALPRIPIPGSSDIHAFASRVTGVHHGLQRLRFGDTRVTRLLSLIRLDNALPAHGNVISTLAGFDFYKSISKRATIATWCFRWRKD